MFETPYQTTPFKNNVFEKTGRGIRHLEIENKLVTLSPDKSITAVPHGVTDFPPFTLFMTKKEIPTLECDVVIDGRLVLKADHSPVKDDVFSFYMNSAKMIKKWQQDDRSQLLRMGGSLLPKLYGQWVKNTIARLLKLDFQQSLVLQAASIVFFLQQVEPLTTNSTGSDMDRLLNRTSNALPRIDVYTVSNLLKNDIPILNTLGDLANWVKVLLDTPRTEPLTETYIRLALIRTWPTAYREIMLAALEYPPLFATSVQSSMRSASFIRTELGELIKASVKSQDAHHFVKSLDTYLAD